MIDWLIDWSIDWLIDWLIESNKTSANAIVYISLQSLDLMSDIGGQAGLWLGMSVISLFEVVELVMVLFGLVCTKLITRTAKTHDANSDAKRDKYSSRRDDKYSAFTLNLSRT